MIPSDTDFDRVGRWLDGEKVELTSAQRALADEIAAAAAVGEALRMPPPAGTLHRVYARVKQAPSVRIRRSWHVGMRVAAAAAAVVGVLLTLPAGPGRGQGELGHEAYVREFLKSPVSNLAEDIAAVEYELADAEMHVMLGRLSPLEVTIAGVADELDRQLAGEEPVEDEGVWQELMQ